MPGEARGPRDPNLRADTYTFHAGDGRGVRWEDATRGVLWLCCTSDQHDGGYAHAIDLLKGGHLYPQLDSAYADGSAAAKWGEFPDEDSLEWGRLVFGLIERVEDAEADLAAGECIRYEHVGRLFAELSREYDGLTTLRMRRSLVYRDDAMARDRHVKHAEILDLLHQLTGDALTEQDYEIETYPYDEYWVKIHFYGEIVTAEEWLEQRVEEAIVKKAYRLDDSVVGF